VVESFVFPTLAYVGGPGEIGYFGQVNALFEACDILPPVVVPRFSGVVVESRIEKALAKLELDFADLSRPRDALREELARREIPPETIALLERIREEWTRGFMVLMHEAGTIDPSLSGALGAVRNRGLIEAARAERKIIRALKRGDRLALGQLDRVLDALRPEGAPQDRRLNVLSFLARHGDHFLADAERAIQDHWCFPEDR